MIVLIDNYDSFVYNIYQYLSELGEKVKVYRNDEISIDGLMKLKNMKAIVLSPGPGNPNDAGICLEVIQEFTEKFLSLVSVWDIKLLGSILVERL